MGLGAEAAKEAAEGVAWLRMSAVSGMRMHASMHMDGCDMIEDMVTLLTCILDLGKRRLR